MPRGRPQIQIDNAQFENLCRLQCTLEEIAGWFACSEDTIERWCLREYKEPFREVYAKKREAGKISLRRAQFRLAENNAAMAIFLGKQYLHQTDDPSKKERGDSVETKLGGFLDALTDAVSGSNPGKDTHRVDNTAKEDAKDEGATTDGEDDAE